MKIDDISTYSDLELALMVLLDYMGTGQTRKKKLGTRYKSVQSLVNQIVDKDEIPAGTGLTIERLNSALLKMEPNHDDYLVYINDIIYEVKEGTK